MQRYHSDRMLASIKDQDKKSDNEQEPPFNDLKKALQSLKRGGFQNQREHHVILTKNEAVHPTVVSENNSSLGMLII